MKKLKILSAILVLVGVAMVGVGGIYIKDSPQNSFDSMNKGKAMRVLPRAVKDMLVQKIIKPAKPVKPNSIYSNITVSYEPEKTEVIAGEVVTVHVTMENDADYTVDDIYFDISFAHSSTNHYVDCVDDPSLGYECTSLDNGTPILTKYIGSIEAYGEKQFDIKVRLPDDAPFDRVQYPEAERIRNENATDSIVYTNLYAEGFALYRILGHFDARHNLKIEVTANKREVRPGDLIVYSVWIRNLDTEYSAEGVKVKVNRLRSSSGCYQVVKWPNENNSCGVLGSGQEVNVGDIAPNSRKLLYYVYAIVDEDVIPGSYLPGIISPDAISGDYALAQVSNDIDSEYVSDWGWIGYYGTFAVKVIEGRDSIVNNGDSPRMSVPDSETGTSNRGSAPTKLEQIIKVIN